jgi:ParB/RepB/Spo0J family partition protein
MIEEQAAQYIADGGSVAQVEEVTGLEFKTVSPDLVAVDAMNERTHDTLDTKDLEDSIAEVGIVEPPVCRVIDPDADVPYGVVQGQRRVTAAKALDLDEIPILIGEFDDLDALTRSITENISSARQEVSTNSRAASIWRWWVLFTQDRGERVEKDQPPSPQEVADHFGIPRQTASDWIEPLRSDFFGTDLDPRTNILYDDDGDRHNDIKIQEVNPSVLKAVRKMGFEKNEAVEVVEEVQKNALTQDELRKVAEVKNNPNISMGWKEAIETQVEARKEAMKAKERFMLKRFYVSGSMAKGLRAAEADLGKPREDIVKIAVGKYLESEGYT